MGAADREIEGPLSLTFKPRPEEVRKKPECLWQTAEDRENQTAWGRDELVTPSTEAE